MLAVWWRAGAPDKMGKYWQHTEGLHGSSPVLYCTDPAGKKMYAKNAEKHKNARNLVIFWTTGKGKYTILLEISCQ